MSTVKRWRAAAISAGFGLGLFFTGCGGGEDSQPQTVAPSSLVTRSYTFNESGGAQTAVSFHSDVVYSFLHTTGAIEQGTYEKSQNGNTITVRLLSQSGGQQIYEMTFGSPSSGSYVLRLEGEDNRLGTFTARASAVPSGSVNTDPPNGATTSTTGNSTGGSSTSSTGNTTGSTTSSTGNTTGSTTSTTGNTTGSTTGTTGNTTGTTSGATTSTTGSTTGATTSTTGSTTGNTTGATTSTTGNTTGTTTGSTTGGSSTEYNGFAPVSIAGRTMFGTRTFTSTGPSGQTHTYTFSADTFHDSDAPEESDGTYTYSASSSAATLNLVYTGPVDFEGDRHNLTLNFTAKDRGTFQSTYVRGDGTSIVINGDFEFEALP